MQLPIHHGMKRRTLSVLATGLCILLAAGWAVAAHIEDITYLPNDHPAIQYAQQPPQDAVAKLAKRIHRDSSATAPNFPKIGIVRAAAISSVQYRTHSQRRIQMRRWA